MRKLRGRNKNKELHDWDRILGRYIDCWLRIGTLPLIPIRFYTDDKNEVHALVSEANRRFASTEKVNEVFIVANEMHIAFEIRNNMTVEEIEKVLREHRIR